MRPAYSSRPGGGAAMSPPGQHQQHVMSPPIAPHKGTLAPGTLVQVGKIQVTVKRYLSEGGFAHVYLVDTAQPIALPAAAGAAPGAEHTHVLKRMAVPDKEALAFVRGEVEIHRSLRSHPNLVHFIEACATSLPSGGYEVFILMEFCSGGGLIDLMNARLRTRLTEKEVLLIFSDVAAGLSAMHHASPPLLHRDLKVENILLSPAPSRPGGTTYKLCDFGSAVPLLSRRAPRSVEEVRRLEAELNRTTTLQYRAPEMVDVGQRRVIDEKADVWAMGVLLYKLCYYTTPFEENGGGPLAILSANYRFPPQPAYSRNVKDLIGSMLQEQSVNRPTIDELLIRAHTLLGTPPPASAVHYANLASQGKLVSELPTLTGARGELGVDAAATALASQKQQQQQQHRRPAAATSGTADLIDMGLSEVEQRRVEEEEARARAEGITPMRRGRPARAAVAPTSTSTTAPAAAAPALAPPANQRPKLTGDARTTSFEGSSAASYGFGDSFAPTVSSADTAAALDLPVVNSATGARTTPLSHSPALPGFSAAPSPSARPSPAPSPIVRAAPAALSPPSKATDAAASSRFPSVEELDARYASPPLSAPAHSSGIATRAFTGEGGTRFGAASSPVVRPSATAAPATGAPLSARWPPLAGAGSSSQEASTSSATSRHMRPNQASSPAHRHSVAAASSLARSSTLDSRGGTERAMPALPARKPMPRDWLVDVKDSSDLARTSGRSNNGLPSVPQEAPEAKASSRFGKTSAPSAPAPASDGSSDEEDEGPEEVEPSIRRSTSVRLSPAASRAPGRVKPPSWFVGSPTTAASMNAATGNGPSPAATAPAAAPAQASSHARLLPAPAIQSPSPEPPKSTSLARAPAWDDDDEDQRAFRSPAANAVAAPPLRPGATGMLVDIGGSSEPPTQLGSSSNAHKEPVKRYVDAGTSPIETSPSPLASPPLVTSPPTFAPVARPAASAMREKYEALSLAESSGVREPEQRAAPLASPPSVGPKPMRIEPTREVMQDGLERSYEQQQPTSAERQSPRQPEVLPSSALQSALAEPARSPVTAQPVSPIRPISRLATPQGSAASTRSPGTSSLVRDRQRSLVDAAAKPAQALKPWEREAAEREAASRSSVVRSSADRGATPTSSTDQPEGFSGVGHLARMWQQNAQRGGSSSGDSALSARRAQEARLTQEAAKEVNALAASRAGTVGARAPGRDV